MEQYEEWPEEDQNFPENYPIQNIMISEMPNQDQFQYRIRKVIPTNNISQEPQIYPSKGQIIEERNKYINYNTNNPNPYYNINNQINNNNHNLKIYYTSQNRGINKNSNNSKDNFAKYESSDGVLRGYTNNFSFYESNSSKIKPKIITNTSSQYNNSNNLNRNNLQYNYQRTNIAQETKRRYQNDINSNIRNRQIINTNENDNPPYIIRVIEDQPVEYISPNQEYENNYNDTNFINDDNNENDYYYNDNEIENRYEDQNFRPPEIQRRMVKRVIHKQPTSQREVYYIMEPQNNLRKNNSNQNIYRNDIDQNINYNNPNFGYRKIYSYDVNQGNGLNLYHPLRRNNTPNIQYSNYSRPIKKIRYIAPNFSKNNNINDQYNDKYAYKTFTEQNNDYIIPNTENNFPRNRSPFVGVSPNINNNRNNIYIYQNQLRPEQREYTSRTEQNQRGYDYEYEEDDDVYEVPEQYNNNKIITNNFNNEDRDYNEERRQNNFSDRPFTRVKNYSQALRNGKKYGVYTQTLEMNRNYNSNNDGEEYEYEVPNNIARKRIKENYSQPKIMRPINEVQRLLKNKREYSVFAKSLRNIRNNEEEIELENEARNNRIRSKANGENNIRYISSNNGRPSREYKTFTQQQDNRTQEQGYILQDIDDSNFEDINTYENQSSKNIEISPNEINENDRMQKQYIQGKDYYERAQMENMQNYGENEVEEDDDNDGEGQMYDSSRLITDKKDNFGIIQNNVENEIINNHDINDEEIEQAQIQMNEGEMEEQRSTENDRVYRREEIPKDTDEEGLSNGKNLKNIETEICEKYYDNQGNYLGERKIITKNKIPKEENLQQDEEYYEEQEEIEENENEYMPYQSSNKKFKKRGENIARRKGPKVDNDKNKSKNQNLKMNKESESKYQSYYGDSNNNVYYEIKKVEEDSKNEKEIGNKKYKQPVTLVKNVTFGIHSENLCVPADDNYNEPDDNNNRESEKQRNTKSNSNNDEKEADEQQIEENAVIEVDEEQNQMTLNQNDGNNNLTTEQNINEKINNNDNENDNNGESENNNENKNIESQNSEQNYNYNYIEENNLNNDDENNYQNYEENNNYYDENINNNEENLNINNKNDEYNMEYENENEEERIYEENEGEEIENQNIQKDEGEEDDIGEGLVDIEQNNNYNYNYQQNQENDYEENQNYDEEGEEMEQREEYNVIEEDNINKDEVNDNKEEN